MDERTYWERIAPRGLSRRQTLQFSAGSGAAIALIAAGCSSSKSIRVLFVIMCGSRPAWSRMP